MMIKDQPKLVSCESGCGTVVSIRASSCPNCGHPKPALVEGTGKTRYQIEEEIRLQPEIIKQEAIRKEVEDSHLSIELERSSVAHFIFKLNISLIIAISVFGILYPWILLPGFFVVVVFSISRFFIDYAGSLEEPHFEKIRGDHLNALVTKRIVIFGGIVAVIIAIVYPQYDGILPSGVFAIFSSVIFGFTIFRPHMDSG